MLVPMTLGERLANAWRAFNIRHKTDPRTYERLQEQQRTSFQEALDQIPDVEHRRLVAAVYAGESDDFDGAMVAVNTIGGFLGQYLLMRHLCSKRLSFVTHRAAQMWSVKNAKAIACNRASAVG